jgi:hypothetical protein
VRCGCSGEVGDDRDAVVVLLVLQGGGRERKKRGGAGRSRCGGCVACTSRWEKKGSNGRERKKRGGGGDRLRNILRLGFQSIFLYI